MKTTAAQAAALIRKEIKQAFPAVKARVTSSNFAGGNAVDIKLEDQTKPVYDAIKEICSKYQYGSFDGMTDSYNYTNSRQDIPQAKYVHVSNNMTDEKRQEVYTEMRNKWAGGSDLPEKYEDGRNMPFHHTWVSDFVWQIFNEAR